MGIPLFIWYTGRDSNPQPSEPESDALSIEPPVHLLYSQVIIATFLLFVKRCFGKFAVFIPQVFSKIVVFLILLCYNPMKEQFFRIFHHSGGLYGYDSELSRRIPGL